MKNKIFNKIILPNNAVQLNDIDVTNIIGGNNVTDVVGDTFAENEPPINFMLLSYLNKNKKINSIHTDETITAPEVRFSPSRTFANIFKGIRL